VISVNPAAAGIMPASSARISSADKKREYFVLIFIMLFPPIIKCFFACIRITIVESFVENVKLFHLKSKFSSLKKQIQ